MAAICNAPFRLLMQELGAGGSVSELISCHGINHGNERTRHMLKIDPREKHSGIQLFGEDASAMSEAAKIAGEFGPKFIDINMGCPVKKVVTKGGGSALMQAPKELPKLFSLMKKAINVPLTIKIRTGWDADQVNAHEIIHIAKNEGVEFVSVHGRTRAQQYSGHANWEYLEHLGATSELPILGNGDLHEAHQVRDRLKKTSCQALLLGRGPLRNPFIFLDSYLDSNEVSPFSGVDYLEVINTLLKLYAENGERERTLLIQIRKHIIWYAAGFPGASEFRTRIFKTPELSETLKITEEFFSNGSVLQKKIQDHDSFMTSGHG